MENLTATVAPGTFRSGLIQLAVLLCVLAALLGIPGVVLLFSREYGAYFIEDLIISGVTSVQALQIRQIVNVVITVISFASPAVMAAGLLITLGGRPDCGLGMLYHAAQWMLYFVNAVAVIALCTLIINVVCYFFAYLPINEGAYLIYAMLISEAFMAALGWLLYKILHRFLDCACDSAASITYTLCSGKFDSVSIPSFTATGFLIMGVFCVMLALDQIFTVTIIENHIQSSYKLLVADHPARYAAAASFLCSAGVNMVLSSYLRRYKRICERALFDSRRHIMGRSN